MRYREAVDYLLSFADFERTRTPRQEAGAFALDRIRSLLERQQHPEAGRLTVHLAGSKGKGSTAAMIESILRAAGLRTGLYTSPHLHEFSERIRIDGQPLGADAFAALVAEIEPIIASELHATPGRLSTFEILTAMAFSAFRAAAVDVQVIEVGLGGRLDTTNVFTEKAAAVITALSREHTAILGDRLEGIAQEKAGIITPQTAAVVLAPQRSPAAAAVVRARAEGLTPPFVDVPARYTWQRAGADRHGQWFRLQRQQPAPADLPESLYLTPLLGLHQIENAVTAVATVEALRDQGVSVPREAFHTGLATVDWPGRMEVLGREPWILVDGAHNAESLERVLESLRLYFEYERLIVVLGTLRDKDIPEFVAHLAGSAAAVVATQPDHPRAEPATSLAQAFKGVVEPVLVEPKVPDALRAARVLAGPRDLICTLGSLFVAAEARACIAQQTGERPASTRAER